MSKHLQRDLDALKQILMKMSADVETAIHKASLALREGSSDLAQEVIAGDHSIDAQELRIEEECLKVLALHQPVAADLRFIIVVLKVNNDLERIGDLSVHVAERALFLAEHESETCDLDFTVMAQEACAMLRASLDALTERDQSLAQEVLRKDDVVDDFNRDMFALLQQRMQTDSAMVEPCLHLLSVSRNLERIADLATNIAEDVIFMVAGEIVRHGTGV